VLRVCRPLRCGDELRVCRRGLDGGSAIGSAELMVQTGSVGDSSSPGRSVWLPISPTQQVGGCCILNALAWPRGRF
jgi:hypothetical protein